MAAAEALSAPLVAKLNTILLNLGEDAIGEEARAVLEHLLGAAFGFFQPSLFRPLPSPSSVIFHALLYALHTGSLSCSCRGQHIRWM